jgi:hypothetical protein
MVALIAQADATNFASGNLSEADRNALQALIAQADALKDRAFSMLQGREAALVPPSRESQATPATSVAGAGIQPSATPNIKDEDKDAARAVDILTPDTTAEKGGEQDGDAATMQVD